MKLIIRHGVTGTLAAVVLAACTSTTSGPTPAGIPSSAPGASTPGSSAAPSPSGSPAITAGAPSVSGSAGAVLGGGRIEVPESGYAITVPEDWTALRPGGQDIAEIRETLAQVAPDLAPTFEQFLASGSEFSLLALSPRTSAQEALETMNIIVTPDDPISDPDFDTQIVEALGTNPALEGEVSSERVDLPSGSALKVNYVLQLEGPAAAVQQQTEQYLIRGSDSVYIISFGDDVAQPERWREIAASFEFSP